MTANGLLQIAAFCAVVTATAIPLGHYMARVFTGERNLLTPVLGPVERAIYWLSGIDAKKEQHWLTYAIAVLLFHVVCFVTLYALMRLQYYLPFNPQGMTGVEPSLALNTAISFTTNTNWQNYGGETTLSYFTQMAGLTVHNFVSAAAGIVVVIALIRGFIRRSAQTIGNFWVDLTRCTPLHPAALLDRRRRWCWSGRACRRTWAAISTPRLWKGPSRRSRKGRSPPRSSSRPWAPTAAASSTSTRRIPTKIRMR